MTKAEMLTKTPVPRLIVKLSLPTIVSMLVTGIYNTADTFFVGTISTQATAAVGIVFSVMAVIQAFGFFCGHRVQCKGGKRCSQGNAFIQDSGYRGYEGYRYDIQIRYRLGEKRPES